MLSKIYELSDEDFRSLIRNSSNKAEVLFKLGYSVEGNSWGYSQLRQRMNELELTPQDFKGKCGLKSGSAQSINESDLLCENSVHSRTVVRRYILKSGKIPYKCELCENEGEWNGKPLALQLDHINGNCSDHRIENLRWLCPNCHSQTETHGSKNHSYSENRDKRYDISQETREQIVELYQKLKNRKNVAKELNLIESVVKQVLLEEGIKSQKSINQEYVIRYDLNHKEIGRYGSIREACQALIDNGEVKTKSIKTCRNTFNRNKEKDIWLNSYWKILTPEEYEQKCNI